MTILPLNAHMKNHIVVIRMSPFLHTRHKSYEEVAVVCFISDLKIVDNLKANDEEVDYIFSHPLKAIHEGMVDGEDNDELVERGGDWWPHEEEFHVCLVQYQQHSC